MKVLFVTVIRAVIHLKNNTSMKLFFIYVHAYLNIMKMYFPLFHETYYAALSLRVFYKVEM